MSTALRAHFDRIALHRYLTKAPRAERCVALADMANELLPLRLANHVLDHPTRAHFDLARHHASATSSAVTGESCMSTPSRPPARGSISSCEPVQPSRSHGRETHTAYERRVVTMRAPRWWHQHHHEVVHFEERQGIDPPRHVARRAHKITSMTTHLHRRLLVVEEARRVALWLMRAGASPLLLAVDCPNDDESLPPEGQESRLRSRLHADASDGCLRMAGHRHHHPLWQQVGSTRVCSSMLWQWIGVFRDTILLSRSSQLHHDCELSPRLAGADRSVGTEPQLRTTP